MSQNNPCNRLRDLLIVRARQLRHDMTPAEVTLWRELRGRRIPGWKFRRQQPIIEANAIADFFCAAVKLVVELDGESHVGKDLHDYARQHRLERAG